MIDSRFVVTILCDDIRREEGGKLSYMGVYSSAVVVPAFPAKLNKLCLASTIYFPEGEGIPGELLFRVFKNKQIMAEVPVAKERLEKIRAFVKTTADRKLRRPSLSVVLHFAPLEIAEQSDIRVRAYCDGLEIRGGRWQVKRAEDPDVQYTPSDFEKIPAAKPRKMSS